MEAGTAEVGDRTVPPGPRTRPEWRPTVAAALATLSVVCCVAAPPIARWLAARTEVEAALWGDLVLGIAWPVAGALVVRAAPRNPVGWVLVSASMIGPYHVAAYYAAADSLPGRDLPLADVAAWFAAWGFAPYFYVLPLALLLFPDGRPLTPRWRPVVLGVLVVAAVAVAARMVAPVATDIAPQVENPVSLPWLWLRHVTLVGAYTCVFLGNLLGLVSVLLRTRRAVGRHRTQMQWLLLGGALLVVGFTLPVPGDQGREIVMALGLLGPPVAIAIAILRHGLFDVELALNRTLVLIVVSALVVGAYAGAVLLLGSVGATSGPGLLLVAGAALAAAAGRTVVQRAVDRLLFGHRRDPYAVVSRVGRHIAPAGEADEALRLLVDALRQALRLPWVCFVDDTGREVAASGRPTPEWHAEPAVALGQPMGELRAGCGVRASASAPRSSARSPRSPPAPAPSRTPAGWSPTSPARAPGSSPPARRNGGGCATTCTTGSAPPSPARPTSSRPSPPGCDGPARTTRPTGHWRSATGCGPPWSTCAASCTTCARRCSTSVAWPAPCAVWSRASTPPCAAPTSGSRRACPRRSRWRRTRSPPRP